VSYPLQGQDAIALPRRRVSPNGASAQQSFNLNIYRILPSAKSELARLSIVALITSNLAATAKLAQCNT
jgi:hypothetical protein